MDVRTYPNQTEHWNRVLIRFLLAFGFWEAFSFPLRILFFSKFYHSSTAKALFMPLSDIYWVGPIAADFIQCLFFGILYGFAQVALPKGILGGLLFGICFAVCAFITPAIYCYNLMQIQPANLWWVWAGFQSVFALTAGMINSLGWEERE